MELPIEILFALMSFTFVLAFLGVWKKMPAVMFIGGALLTFVFILTDSVSSLGASQTCTTVLPSTTTCEFSPYELDVWVKLIFCVLGSVFMIMGVLLWKATDE